MCSYVTQNRCLCGFVMFMSSIADAWCLLCSSWFLWLRNYYFAIISWLICDIKKKKKNSATMCLFDTSVQSRLCDHVVQSDTLLPFNSEPKHQLTHKVVLRFNFTTVCVVMSFCSFSGGEFYKDHFDTGKLTPM